jgi:hypothetical protein
MASSARSGTAFVAGMFLVASLAAAAHAQSSQYLKPTELPNPYRLVEGWPTLPPEYEWRPLLIRGRAEVIAPFSYTICPLTMT